VPEQMAKTLEACRSGLVTYVDVMISSIPIEATNDTKKAMKRQAFGFRDMEFFKLKILATYETKYAVEGCIARSLPNIDLVCTTVVHAPAG
jgi:transposase